MSNSALQIELNSSTTVTAGTNVLFDTVTYSSGSITYNSVTGVLTFTEAGRYLIDWWVATSSSQSINGAALALVSSQGDFIIGEPLNRTSDLYGVGIVDVTLAPVTLSLKNVSPVMIYLSSLLTLKGTLVIMEDDISLTGPTGDTGPTGPAGDTGPTGPGIATFGYVYNPTATENAAELGTDILFPHNGPINGILHTEGTAPIVVMEAGNYLIEYTVVLTNNIDASLVLAVNGTDIGSTLVPAQSVLGEYSDSVILALEAGDSVTLRIE